MNDTTYTGYILDRHRAADLLREHEMLRAHRERGQSPARPAGQPLSAWFRGADRTGREAPRGAGAAASISRPRRWAHRPARRATSVGAR
ncbi:hypothetical protein ACFC1I_12015 [Microbacterium sp. NPDC056044]|uniref:hypothetical protein n=1 Tax=Microbacterium sp. NPDC056044 TaxID=3345690 RepID=UPI0035DCD756